jgi:hypothetical protein
MSNENEDLVYPLEIGRKLLIEVEIVNRVSLPRSVFGRSLYAKDKKEREVEETFVITRIHFDTFEDIKNKVLEAVTETLRQIS